MSDVYELSKSEQVQDVDKETPYESKQWNFVNDINSGVYTNSQQSLVQFDLSSIYNSGAFIDVSQMYLTIPLIYTAAYSTGTAAVAPTAAKGNEWLLTPKSGYWNLIQSLEVTVNGKTVIQQQPNVNFHVNFKMLSQMSKDDLQTLGKTLGMSPDDAQSYLFNGTSSAQSATVGPVFGNGLTNNSIFPVVAATTSINGTNVNAGVAGIPNGIEQAACANYCVPGTVYNSALQQRSLRMANNQTSTSNGFTQLFNANNLNNEFLPYYTVNNTNYMTWYDVALIRLCDVCDFFQQAPLTKNFDGLLRIYLNTGAMLVGMTQATAGGMSMTGSNSSFVNTCPFTVNQLPAANLTASTTNLAVSCTIARSTVSTSLGGIILANSGAVHPMNSCRCYYPMIKLKPSVALKYIAENRAKKIVFTNVLSNVFSNISAGATYSQLVQSGVRNIKGILIIPFISQATHGALNTGVNAFTNAITTFAPYQSPFDTAPCTTPMSLTQLNVSIGGANELMNFYNYTYENFVQQINVYEKINSADMGLSCGLISQEMWEHAYRFYYVDCSRSAMADQNAPRNVNITFLNNSLQNIDVWTFVEYFDEKVLDVELGRID